MRARKNQLYPCLSILYLVTVFALEGHEFLFAADNCAQCEKQCAQCEKQAALGPFVESACGGSGPCTNPEHHHHPPKHPGKRCPLCQEGNVALAGERIGPAGTANRPSISSPACVRSFIPSSFERSHGARAPPGRF